MSGQYFEDQDYMRYRALYHRPMRNTVRAKDEYSADELLEADEIDGREESFLRGYEIP